jgi:class 3 adenylate cyclase
MNTSKLIESPNIKWPRVIIVTLTWFMLLSTAHFTRLFEFIDNRFSWPMLFHVREILGKSPQLDPRIKIYAIDDIAVEWLKSPSLTLPQWTDLLRSMQGSKPKAVFIDKIYGFEEVERDSSRVSNRKAEFDFRRLNLDVTAGSYVAPSKLAARVPLDLSSQDYNLENMFPKSMTSVQANGVLRKLNLPRASSPYAYGPYPKIRAAFRHVGHIENRGDNQVSPLIRINKTTVLPHISIFAADKMHFEKDGFYLDGAKVPLNSSGRILVNFSSYQEYMQNIKSLRKNLMRAFSGKPFIGVNPGDFVFILPLMYTGNTDFKETALGLMPASFPHISILNSILTSTWLKPMGSELVVAAVACTLAVILTAFMSPLLIVTGSSVLIVSWLLFSILTFSYLGWVLPWFIGLVAYMGPAGFVLVSKTLREEKRVQLLRNALYGAVEPKKLRNIVRNSREVNLSAKEQVLTIMFIDVVGYSLLAQNQVPRVAFDQLKYLLEKISEEVHRYGGIVNKTLGDGMLCLFGYRFDREAPAVDHAEKAVECAIRIQERNLARNLKAFMKGEQVYPLRIGIHTASVFVGDLGTGERIDFTAVGNGVNHSKRMEGACEIHSVLFSSTTKDLVASLGLNQKGLKKRMISIKHQKDLVEAYEYDPFFGDPERRVKAIEAYRHCASLARMDKRFAVLRPKQILIESSVGDGHMINFSNTGISVKLKSLLVKGSTLVLNFNSRDGELARKFKEAKVGQITGEVRWVYSESDGHVHGVLYRDLDEATLLQIVEILKGYNLASAVSTISGLKSAS